MSLISEKVSSVAQAQILESQQLSAGEILQGQAHIHLATANYSFAVNGGGQVLHQLPLSVTIPAGAIYVGIIVETVVPLNSAGAATVALSLAGGALLNPTPVAFNAAPFDGLAGSARYNTDVVIKLGGAVTHLDITFAAANITAGNLNFAVQYIL